MSNSIADLEKLAEVFCKPVKAFLDALQKPAIADPDGKIPHNYLHFHQTWEDMRRTVSREYRTPDVELICSMAKHIGLGGYDTLGYNRMAGVCLTDHDADMAEEAARRINAIVGTAVVIRPSEDLVKSCMGAIAAVFKRDDITQDQLKVCRAIEREMRLAYRYPTLELIQDLYRTGPGQVFFEPFKDYGGLFEFRPAEAMITFISIFNRALPT